MREEREEPPGGEDYTNPSPEPGAVKDDHPEQTKQALERASQLQAEQKRKQQGG
jgi:hypothetical protein